ncbi:MAG: hypothetical protein KDC71_22230 [Acidobacteria bacterium]|nr:hypothetical protein [Acidobacteriota bacterium]
MRYFLLILSSWLAAQTPSLVKELNSATAVEAPSFGNAVPFNGYLFFKGYSYQGNQVFFTNGSAPPEAFLALDCQPVLLGNQLLFFGPDGIWKSDGSVANTSLFYSDPDITPSKFQVAGNILFFSTTYPGTGSELWRTDGTPSGTFLLKDIRSGQSGSDPQHLTKFGSSLVFSADDGSHGRELWISDGTPAGTNLLQDINAGSSGSNPQGFYEFNGQLYFSAEDSSGDRELWRSDGSLTQRFVDLNTSSSSNPAFFQEFNNQLYFGCDDGSHGFELWRTDGTGPGTSRITDLNPGPASGYLGKPYTHQGKLYFLADDGMSGPELCVYNGSGTTLIDAVPGNAGLDIKQFFALGSNLFFIGKTSTSGTELWQTNGTLIGTQIVVDLNPGSSDGINNPIVFNNKLYFAAIHDNQRPWVSDGTAGGTQALVSALSPMGSNPNYFTAISGGIFFLTEAIPGTRKLAFSDATSGGTQILNVTNLNDPRVILPAGNKAFIIASSNNALLNEVWISDGTVNGTTRLRSHTPNLGASITEAVVVNNKLYYSALEEPNFSFWALWESDGTSAGTQMVNGPMNLEGFFPIGNQLLMSNWADELYRFDPGTQTLNLIDTVVLQGEFISFQNSAFFAGSYQSNNVSLLRTDGATITVVKTLFDGQTNLVPNALTVIGNTLYFQVINASLTNELWQTDGSQNGTQKVVDLPANVDRIWGLKDRLYFLAKDQNGWEIWTSDKTQAGTHPFFEVAPLASNGASSLFKAQERLFFTGWRSDTGFELWTSDGTAMGTQMVADLLPGPGSGYFSGQVQYNKQLFFGGTSTLFNPELYKLAVQPNAAIWAPESVCPSTSGLTACTVNDPGAAYSWSITNGTINTGSNTDSIQFTAGTSGSVTLNLIVQKNGLSSTRQVAIPITQPLSTLSTISGTSAPCANEVSSYSIQAAPGADTYTWQVPLGSTILSGQGTTAISMLAGNAAGVIQVQALNSCFTSPVQSLNITPYAQPPSQPASPSGTQQVCSGETATFTISTLPGLTYLWTVPTGATILAGQGSNSIQVSFGSQSGLIGVQAGNGCGFSPQANLNISVYTPPSSADAGPDQNLMAGQTATLAAQPPSTGSGLWSILSGPNTNPSQFSDATSPASSFSPIVASGTYQLRWTVSNGPCLANSDDVFLHFAAPQTIDLQLDASPSQSQLSVGEPVVFTLSLSNTSAPTATGISVHLDLPVSFSPGPVQVTAGSYDSIMRTWQISALAGNSSQQLQLQGFVNQLVAGTLSAEVTQCNEMDVDSVPNNGLPGEDDMDQWNWTILPYLQFADPLFKSVLINNPAIDLFDDDEISVYEALNVTTLDCSQNNIADLSGIESFLNLTDVDASQNGLTHLPNLQGLTQLKTLLLNGNGITELEDSLGQIVLPGGLESLNLADNDLGDLSPNLFLLSQLHSLDLSANNLASVPDQFDQLIALESLFLDQCHLPNLPPSIGLIANLSELSLNYNGFEQWPNFLPSGLVYLSARGNRIHSLTILATCPNLEFLDLGRNQIQDIFPLTTIASLLTNPNHSVFLDHNWLDSSSCTEIQNLQGRATMSGAYLQYNPQGNFALLNAELPQWPTVANRLQMWVIDVSTEPYLYSLSCP